MTGWLDDSEPRAAGALLRLSCSLTPAQAAPIEAEFREAASGEAVQSPVSPSPSATVTRTVTAPAGAAGPPGPAGGPPTAAENPRNLALGGHDSHRLDPDHRPAAGTLTSSKPPLRSRKEQPGAPWNPRPPDRQPGHRHNLART